MPLLPLPPDASLGGGDLPVVDGEDVRAVLPAEMRASDNAPIRDAITDAFAAGFVEYQILAERAAAQVDPLRATGDYLRAIAEEKGVIPTRNETDASIRARLFSNAPIVTPDAIVSVVSGILAPYTASEMTYFEPELDGMFICDGTVNYGFLGSDPTHLDRLYPDDEVTNGVYIPHSSPGGAALSNGYPRTFVIRIPALEGADDNFAFISTTADGAFLTDGTEVADYDPAFIFADTLTADELYTTIVSTVQTIKGQGISWTMFVDPTL